MLLKTVSFRDYCLYAGEQTFNLAPKTNGNNQAKKPVVLFGGKNGAGKTTLLDALRLGLYGKQSFEENLTEPKYKEALRSRIHQPRNGSKAPQSAKIAIEFDLSSLGQTNSYRVERIWEDKEGKIEERLRVSKDDRLLDEIDAEHWPTFIAEIVPERLSQLFFFDGEKIKSIAEDISSNQAIASSIRSLLGLDIVDRLNTDLGIFLARRVKVSEAEEAIKELNEHLSETEKIDEKIGKLRQRELPEIQTKIQSIQNEINKIENKLRETGWSYASERDQNKAKEEVYQNRISDLERDLRLETEREFAFSLCPNIAQRLMDQLAKDEETKKLLLVKKETEGIENQLKEKIGKLNNLQEEVSNEVLSTIKEVFYPYKKDDDSIGPVVHQISPSLQARIARIFMEIAPRAAKRIENLNIKFERNHSKLSKTKRELDKAPQDDLIQPTISLLSQQNRELGKLQEKKIEIDSELISLEFAKKESVRKAEAAQKEINKKAKGNQKANYVNRLKPVLEEYEKEITKLKISSLEKAVAECFQRIIRKPGFAEKVTVDPETFEAKLYDPHGNPIPRSDLSSGEKQIFAISVLWGLAKTSGRPLPVVIDTPLGRLDSEHRKNLVNNYFPEAAHQVIMLSTDTEVDESLYKDLEPHLSHCYELVYDSEKGATQSKPNYFWK